MALICDGCNQVAPISLVIVEAQNAMELTVEIDSRGLSFLRSNETQALLRATWGAIQLEASTALPAFDDLSSVNFDAVATRIWVLSYVVLLPFDDGGMVQSAAAALVARINTGETVIAVDVEFKDGDAQRPTAVVVGKVTLGETVVSPSAVPPSEESDVVLITISFCNLDVGTSAFDGTGFATDTVNAVLDASPGLQTNSLASVGVRVGPTSCAEYVTRNRRDLTLAAAPAKRSFRAVSEARGVSVDLYLSGFDDRDLFSAVVTGLLKPPLAVPLSTGGIGSIVLTPTSIVSVPDVGADVQAERNSKSSWWIRSGLNITIIVATMALLCFICCLLLIRERRRWRPEATATNGMPAIEPEWHKKGPKLQYYQSGGQGWGSPVSSVSSDHDWLEHKPQSHFYPGGAAAPLANDSAVRYATAADSPWYVDPHSRQMTPVSKARSPQSRSLARIPPPIFETMERDHSDGTQGVVGDTELPAIAENLPAETLAQLPRGNKDEDEDDYVTVAERLRRESVALHSREDANASNNASEHRQGSKVAQMARAFSSRGSDIDSSVNGTESFSEHLGGVNVAQLARKHSVWSTDYDDDDGDYITVTERRRRESLVLLDQGHPQ
jgi:hypothetical protein